MIRYSLKYQATLKHPEHAGLALSCETAEWFSGLVGKCISLISYLRFGQVWYEDGRTHDRVL